MDDKYLQRKYGITLAEREAQLSRQKNCCGICGSPAPASGRALHTDHDHRWARVKVEAAKVSELGWRAWADYNGITYSSPHRFKRAEAVKYVKQKLKRASWRGIVCWACNTLLAKGRDNPKTLRAAADYLERFSGIFEKDVV